MNIFDATILGVIEGFTEFLPISSTGHMILASTLFKIEQSEFLKSFEIIIQLGAILAVVVLYARMLVNDFGLIKKVLVAFVPTAFIGLFFYKFVKAYLLDNNLVVLISLFIGGIIILWFSNWEDEKNRTDVNAMEGIRAKISYKQAFWVGVFQAIAIVPGVSRSASTIVGGRLIGVPRKDIVEFSFLLAIPTMVAASGLDILKNYQIFDSTNILILAVGFIVSFVVAIVAIKGFLAFVRKYSFSVFGWYRIVVSIALAYFLFM